ncbi:MAG: ABC transporter ATP-binding protein/permease [Oscillospiraceae bacterium]|jgi:ATP-binding cassette subfamily B protein|nr:ABC transporter ATP-binding protein/permease [Oscillospiraceae bacterium]
MPAEKAKNFGGAMRRLAGYLRPQWPAVAAVFVMTILSVGSNIAGPRIMETGINELVSAVSQKISAGAAARMDFTPFGRALTLMLGAYLAAALFLFVQSRLMTRVSRNVIYHMRREVDRKLSRLPLSYYDGTGRGEILSRVTNDIDNISATLQQNLTQIVTAVFTLFGVLIMMFTIHATLTLLCLLTLPLMFLATALIMRRSQKYFGTQWASTGALGALTEEAYTGHEIITAFGREEAMRTRFGEENTRLYRAGFRAQFLSGIIMPMMWMLNNLNFVVVCVYGGVQVAGGAMSFGAVQAMIQYARQFTQPIQQTSAILNMLQSTAASAERVFELLDVAEETPDTGDTRLSDPRGAVCFENVSFAYRPDAPLIAHMNLSLRPGQRVAIVGPTGAGKTTIVNLLMRFYELDEGRITVDGTDIRSMRRRDLRALFGMVLQDTWLFHGTIRENIAYGRQDADAAAVRRAASVASVDHFVRTLEHGYDTEINDDATNISQGQKQLLTIARAFLSDPQILILDEATSSVDTRTEILIQRAMEKLMQNRTSFIIAHRLSTIRDADLILVMRDGAIVEQGRHEELLAQGGFYAEMYNSQFAEEATS